MSLAAVRDLRVARAPVTAEDLATLETDVLAGFVLARAASRCAISCHAPSSERGQVPQVLPAGTASPRTVRISA